MARELIVAIDGPAAAGKSTVGRMLADRLGYLYLDTGALYRAAAWLARREGAEGGDAVAELVYDADIRLEPGEQGVRVFVDDEEITGEIRTEEIGGLASTVSALPEVREALLDLQRRLGRGGGVVMDGRDIGTVIFPQADAKFFLDASAGERGRRRWLELRERGVDTTLEEVVAEVSLRDRRDESRAHAPLRAAVDAVRIDSTGLSPDEVLERMLAVVERRRHPAPRKAPPLKSRLRVAVLYRELDMRFRENFPRDIEGREDDSYHDEIIGALKRRGHDAYGVRIREDALDEIRRLDCDVAFNMVEEGLNNDSRLEPHLPAILEVFGIPCTGGDFLSIALTGDKSRAKELLQAHRIPTPAFQRFVTGQEEVSPCLRFPLIVKPVREDAGIGISLKSVVRKPDELRRQVRRVIRTFRQPAIAEEYIHGREFSVAVFDHRGRRVVTPLSEVEFLGRRDRPRVFTYRAKWDDESGEFDDIDPTVCPAQDVPPAVERAVRRLALETFDALRLRGYGRVDFRLDEAGRLFVLEVNANPLIGEDSIMAVLARRMGWYFPTFIHNIVMEAYRRSRRTDRGITLRDLPPGT